MKFCLKIILILLLSMASLCWAKQPPEKIQIPQVSQAQQVDDIDAQQQSMIKVLNEISLSITEQMKAVEKKMRLLMRAKSEQEKKQLQSEIANMEYAISQQAESFEMILTTGLQLNNKKPEKVEFNWQKDLLEIIQPIMNELHEMTAVKRELNRLQQQMSFYQSQIRNSHKALNHMKQTDQASLKPSALARFKQVQEKWQMQLDDSEHLLEVAQLRHAEMQDSQTAEVTIGEQIKAFFAGRGNTMLIAVGAFFLVFVVMKLLWKPIDWVQKKSNKRKTYMQRVIALIYHLIMIILAITAVFYVFSLRNDQVLTGIGVLLLVIIIWALKSSIPGYIAEIQTFLHAGPVREGERIVYNGVPLQVGDLNFHTKLTNPDLPGLVVRLPLSDLLNYVSRPLGSDEPWFPCKVRDFVLLSDGTYGMVKHISIESVVLSLSDGRMPKTYMVSEFLAASPRNLSQGFFVTSEFGIDYKYQQNCTTEIPEIFRAGIRQGLAQETFGSALLDLTVQFCQANASSLDYKIFAKFDGQAASDYYPIMRALQRYAVEVCNQQQWEIPFAQLTVHRQEDQVI